MVFENDFQTVNGLWGIRSDFSGPAHLSYIVSICPHVSEGFFPTRTEVIGLPWLVWDKLQISLRASFLCRCHALPHILHFVQPFCAQSRSTVSLSDFYVPNWSFQRSAKYQMLVENSFVLHVLWTQWSWRGFLEQRIKFLQYEPETLQTRRPPVKFTCRVLKVDSFYFRINQSRNFLKFARGFNY